MLHPSYSELMDIFNEDNETGNKVSSRYTIVIAAAKRARQLIDGARPAAGMEPSDKAVSLAVDEMRRRKVKIRQMGESQEDAIDQVDDFVSDKSIFRTREDFSFHVPSYEEMVKEMKDWITNHKELYPNYYNYSIT